MTRSLLYSSWSLGESAEEVGIYLSPTCILFYGLELEYCNGEGRPFIHGWIDKDERAKSRRSLSD
jgi:hypothetical protein